MDSTIAAIATAFGEGGVGIVRISGNMAKEILEKIFVPKFDGNELENRKLVYGVIRDPKTNEDIDEVLSVYMKGPGTYTREDVVEINCHGSVISLKKVLSLVLANGAELAEPGEFTKRAFLNGRLDLSQAEAVIDLIKAKTDMSFGVALSQLEGSLSKEILNIRAGLLDALVNITVNIDYPDEDIEEVVYNKLLEDIDVEREKIIKLLNSANTGKIIKDGLKVAIVGKPNVGKSSLMNAILKESRAIVTEIAGTTRDTIEEQISIRGIPVQLVDTAGIRETQDTIEAIGIEKSKETFNNADLVILVMDISRSLSPEDELIIEKMHDRHGIVVVNKVDLESVLNIEELEKRLPNSKILMASMKNNFGLDGIEDEIEEMVYGGKVKQSNSMLITNARHEDLLNKSLESLDDGKSIISMGEPLEFIEVDVKRAYDYLGEIIGETATDDIIDEVFARFCLGK